MGTILPDHSILLRDVAKIFLAGKCPPLHQINFSMCAIGCLFVR